jgi:hypothetical protein
MFLSCRHRDTLNGGRCHSNEQDLTPAFMGRPVERYHIAYTEAFEPF